MERSHDWLSQAQRDLVAAETNAAAGLHEWAAFASQQCAEKAVKALIQHLHGAERGHSISNLLNQLGSSTVVPDSVLDAAQELDRVYVTARYPNGFASGSPFEHFSESSSRRLIQYARTVYEFCRSQMARPEPGP